MNAVATTWAFGPVYWCFSNSTYGINVVRAEIKNPIDSDSDGLVDDFAESWNTNTGSVFGFTNGTATTNCIIPCRVRILPDIQAVRDLYTDNVRIRLSPIGTSHNASGPYVTTISWDHSFPGEATAGKAVYNSGSGLWEATATFAGLPAVPANSWGRVPADLHNLLYGPKTNIVSFLGSLSLPDTTNLYEVYYGDSLVVNGSRLVDIRVYSNDVNTLVASDPVRREIYEKMLCSLQGGSSEFEFTTLTKAQQNFAMRAKAVQLMDGMNTGTVDVSYCNNFVSPPIYPRVGDTIYNTNSSSWTIGTYWIPDNTNWAWCSQFLQEAGTSAHTAINNVTPFRGECAGAMDICVFQGADNALGGSAFDVIHPAGSLGLHIRDSEFAIHCASVTDTNTFVPGDYVYMRNKEDYPTWAPSGFWRGENCLYMGTNTIGYGTFSGLGEHRKTEDQMREDLRIAYTNDCNTNGVIIHIVENPTEQIIFTSHTRLVTGN